MINDILQTDINLAKRLKSEQHTDQEIIKALVQRGVDPVKAAQLVDDLNNGRPLSAQPAAPPEFTAERRSRSKARPPESESEGFAPKNGTESSREPRPQHKGRGGKKAPLMRYLLMAIIVMAIILAAVIYVRNGRERGASEEQSSKPAGKAAVNPASAKPTSNAPDAGKANSLVLELQPDGLRIGGSRVTAENVLAVLGGLLGVASRTNDVGRAGSMVYAYDSRGLMVYYQKEGKTNSIVLDCEGTGGANGTTAPFTGRLKVEDQTIDLNADAQALAGIEKLGLGKPKNGSSIWSGQYHNLDLVFAYLRGHLSLVEIDLK